MLGGKLVIKDAPKNTPERLRPYMRLVATLRYKYEQEGKDIKPRELLKKAGEVYRQLKPEDLAKLRN